MSSTTNGPTPPTDASEEPTVAPGDGQVREPSALTLAAMAAVAVPGLDPARLALPQQESATLRVVGVIDTQGRHWEVHQARTDAAGASLDAEAEVLRRVGRVHDAGRLSFNVSRPAGSLRREDVHIQVRSHVSGRPVEVTELRPGPGLSAGLGKALGELHELPTEVVSEAGMPVYDAEEVRERWVTVLDEAAATGKVPPALLQRWEQVLEHTALWRFRPGVVHGDLAEENILVAGGAVVGMRGLDQVHVGDPAEDMAWVYANVPVDCLDSVEAAYDIARTEGVDRHLRDRAELVSEMSLARWLLHGVRSGSEAVTQDAVSMLQDLATQVGEEPLIEVHEPRLAPVEGEKEVSSPSATTREIAMVRVDDDGCDGGADDAAHEVVAGDADGTRREN